VADLRHALDRADVLAGHARAQPRLDRWILEVKEVPRVVPDEAALHDRAAVAAGLVRGLADQHARVGMLLAPPVREAQAADTRADHENVARVACADRHELAPFARRASVTRSSPARSRRCGARWRWRSRRC